MSKKKIRVLFENDEIGFEHAYVSYNDGNREALMTYYKYKDGKVCLYGNWSNKVISYP